MLTYNAPQHVEIAIRSLRRTQGVRFELVVVDNASDVETRDLLRSLYAEKLIDTLHFSPTNTLFAGGNNLASTLASPEATHFLLLNSDVEIRSNDWLSNLLAHHARGATSYGLASDPLRLDGYCLLIDADLYHQIPLDESHQWWWSVTKQQAALLRLGHSVCGFAQHEDHLHHFGGASGSGFAGARGMEVTRREVERWFDGRRPVILDAAEIDPALFHELQGNRVRRKIASAVHRMKMNRRDESASR